MGEDIIVGSITIWAVSFSAGFIMGAILRLSLYIHALAGGFMLGWQVGRQGLGHYVATLARGWVIGLIVAAGILPGYLCGYFITDVLCKAASEGI